jgi:hypothetical protein
VFVIGDSESEDVTTAASRTEIGGLTPHDKHGGIDPCDLSKARLKFDGRGFEK